MGDVVGDSTESGGCVEWYNKAWIKSGNRFARAQRSLGAFYFKKQMYEESIDAYQKAFEINPMFENSWFVMGCACLKLENFALALTAFNRCVLLDSNVISFGFNHF